MNQAYKIAIIGAGPGGLSAAAHAAELGVAHILLEATPQPANTIYKYQKGKHVMAEPAVLPLRSPMSFAAGTREKILGTWDEELKKHHVNIRFNAQVSQIQKHEKGFDISLANGEKIQAECVVLAIGVQGNIRKLGKPGEDLARVQYQLDDPAEYEGETIVVIGGGDAGIENAIGLARQNRVYVINRDEEFNRCKEGNLSLLMNAVKEGRIETRVGTSVSRVDAIEGGSFPLHFIADTPSGQEIIPCHRVVARLGATPPRKLVESFGVVFPNNDATAVPELSASYESNVKGLYIIGALGGYPLIKQSMNQGYEVIEYILGRDVEPADEPLLKQKFNQYRKHNTVHHTISLIQYNVPLLSSLTTLQLREFLLESTIHMPESGSVIFENNDYTNSMYFVLEGDVIVRAKAKDGDTTDFFLYTGECFGELGLISGRRRTATVLAGEYCILIETPRRSMLKLLANVPPVKRALDQMSLKRALRSNLGASLPEKELDYLVQSAEVKKFNAGQTIFNEGDAADGLYLIRRGSVTVSRRLGGKEVVMSYVPAGNYVGEMALISGAPRSATVKAAVAVETVLLEASRVTEVLKRNRSMQAELDKIYLDRMRDNQAMEQSPETGNVINFLVQQGIGEATDVLLIDEALCVRCNNCEKACADTHGGTSRLDREAGPTYANIHVPTSCRHCEHPHCMKECPPDAIHRSANGEVFISEACIGCGNCERNCPYGVIQMAALNPERKKPSLSLWMLFGLGAEPGSEAKNANKDIPKKAVKCDMCKELPAGPSCVRACPTGAAKRISPEKFLDFASSRHVDT
jgi:CRP-like cAMP-binding protein/thioredoxin reductase/Fe-S-cluster-containing hydrogenase component 2